MQMYHLNAHCAFRTTEVIDDNSVSVMTVERSSLCSLRLAFFVKRSDSMTVEILFVETVECFFVHPLSPHVKSFDRDMSDMTKRG